ncbi:MAG TPA: hypothetical protein ACYCC8_00435 [Candidatus Azoamicus sp.]
MFFINEICIFSLIIKKNKKYSYYFNKNNFPCIINKSNSVAFLILKTIKLNNNKLIAVKNILTLIKNNKKK